MNVETETKEDTRRRRTVVARTIIRTVIRRRSIIAWRRIIIRYGRRGGRNPIALRAIGYLRKLVCPSCHR